MSRLQKIGLWLAGIGFAGLGLSRLIADWVFGGEKQLMQLPGARFVVPTFSFLWLVGVVVLLPAAVLLERRRMPESQMTIYPWWQWVLLFPYSDHDNDAKVPRWIWIPLFAVGFLLAGALLVIFSILGLHHFLTH